MRRFRRAAAMGLAATMVLSMAAGCGNKTDSGSGNNGSSAGGEESGKAEITMMTFDFEGSPVSGDHADEVVSIMEEYTDTTVDFTWVANDAYEEKLGLALASPDDMPMIIAVGGMTSAITSAAEAGAFWNLSDYMFDSEKYPNLSQANENVCESLTVGGNLIGVYRQRPIGRYGIGYRADWAEALGIDEPETIEDLYDMMYKFTYEDPDGNGKDDTYGLALCSYTGPFDIMQTYFGCGNGWVEQDGELVPIHQTDEYMEALEWFKKMYDDGLVYEDWAVRDTATWKDSVKNGECGIFIDVLDGSRSIWDYFVNNDIEACPGSSSYETAAMNLVGTINDKTLATSGYNGFFVITKAADTEEKLEDCLHFLDKMCDDDMILLSSYGLEGVHWEKDANGYLVDLDKEDPVASKAYQALNQTVAYIPNAAATSITVEKTERNLIEEQIKKDNEEFSVFNPASAYLANSSTFSLNGTNLDQILADARTQYICGEIDETGLKAAWDNWSAQGGSDVIKEVNEQYKASK